MTILNTTDGLKVGSHGAEVQAISAAGVLYQQGTAITATAAQLNKVYSRFTVTALDGSTGKKACSTNGVSAIAGGTGIADMSLAAPSDGDVATIRIASITSGSVVVTTATGVTIDGTSLNTITLAAANDFIVLAYKSATQWQTVMQQGAALSEA
jgi:hypothetical protein